MSALAMILTAAMAVPGDVPEKGAGETAQKDQGLDLKGKWVGSFHTKLRDGSDCTDPVVYRDDKLTLVGEDETIVLPMIFTDEGKGKGRYRSDRPGEDGLCIYKWQGDQLVICFDKNRKTRPTNFKVEGINCLLILRRIKPAK